MRQPGREPGVRQVRDKECFRGGKDGRGQLPSIAGRLRAFVAARFRALSRRAAEEAWAWYEERSVARG